MGLGLFEFFISFSVSVGKVFLKTIVHYTIKVTHTIPLFLKLLPHL